MFRFPGLMLLLASGACKDQAPDDSVGSDSGSTSDDSAVSDGLCPVTIRYVARGGAAAVYVAGSFNDWDDNANELAEVETGVFQGTLELPPGAWPYKLVEATGAQGRNRAWSCDPAADFAQCDASYTWDPSCPLDGASCNSMLVVEDCSAGRLEVQRLAIDREGNAVEVDLEFSPGPKGAALDQLRVSLDGAPWDPGQDPLTLRLTGLDEGRHSLLLQGSDVDGEPMEPVTIPFWTDDRDWSTGLMYWVFVDRFHDGDAGNNQSEGTSHAITDYLGGDWRGVLNKLDYLDGLGVTALWITAPQDNPSGAWGEKCDADFSGYHGYWPAHPDRVEEHFGTEDDFRELVQAAQDRGMRVLVDWVGNHVHEEHPYRQDHPEWFNDELICQGDVWNTDPETCWFDPFLPDINYYQPEPLVRMVDDATDWIHRYGLDGYRVDAVKHMPHSVFMNLQSRIRNEVEFRHAGGDQDFYTVGETYSGDRGLIGSYVNERELDAQFDFPLYWSILGAFARNEGSLRDLEQSFQDSQAAFAGHTMSTFLGNHDVERFLAHASGEVGSLYGDGPCGGDGRLRGADSPAEQDAPYQRLRLAWTWLLTHEGLALVYYGDELGLEGYADPDNRHLMRFDGELSAREAGVLQHVRALGQARRDHPAFAVGQRSEWWSEDDVLAWARVHEGDAVLAVVNRSTSERTLSNGLEFAGLPSGARYVDVLDGSSFQAQGDSLTVSVPALGSRVLIPE